MIRVVGIGGTAKPGSSTEEALKIAIDAAKEAGAETHLFDGAALLALPHYGAVSIDSCPEAQSFVDAVRNADGFIVASPGYHGSVSGAVKNAIDWLEETSRDSRVYLEGIPVGLVATAYGWQATGSTMIALRSIVHALRGWPTPMGACVRTHSALFADGACTEPDVVAQLRLVGQQVVEFATMRQKLPRLALTNG